MDRYFGVTVPSAHRMFVELERRGLIRQQLESSEDEARASQRVGKCDEGDASEDRPEDRERVARDSDDGNLGQVEKLRQPGANKGTEKPKENRQNEASSGAARDSTRNCATCPCDDEIDHELEYGHRQIGKQVRCRTVSRGPFIFRR